MNQILLAHGGDESGNVVAMTTATLLKNSWNWDPLVIIPLLMGILIYLWWVDFKWNKQTVLFLLGNFMIFMALISPIATIGETYLFSVHMIQHLLLEIVAVPLLVLSMPKKTCGPPVSFFCTAVALAPGARTHYRLGHRRGNIMGLALPGPL